MLPNLSATPPFATLLRKDEDSKPSCLPPDSNLKNSLTMLTRKVCNTSPRKARNRYWTSTNTASTWRRDNWNCLNREQVVLPHWFRCSRSLRNHKAKKWRLSLLCHCCFHYRYCKRKVLLGISATLKTQQYICIVLWHENAVHVLVYVLNVLYQRERNLPFSLELFVTTPCNLYFSKTRTNPQVNSSFGFWIMILQESSSDKLESRRPSTVPPSAPSQLGWDDDFVMVELVSYKTCPKLTFLNTEV